MKNNKLVFEKINYIIMLVGIVVLFLGFFIMWSESGEYGFGFMGLTLAPIIILLGFGIQFVAIFYKSKKSLENENNNDETEDLNW